MSLHLPMKGGEDYEDYRRNRKWKAFTQESFQ